MSNDDDYDRESFMEKIRETLQDGGRITPFLGSGISAPSGILMGQDFANYLGYVVSKVLDENPWDLRLDGWPKYPNKLEVLEAKKHIFNIYEKIGVKQKFEASPQKSTLLEDEGTHVQSVYSIISEKLTNENAALTSGYPVGELTRPLVPEFIRSAECQKSERELEALRQSLNISDQPNDPNGSASSEWYIKEKAVRALSHWTTTLEFLSTVAVGTEKKVGPKRTSLYLDKPESFVVDSFNAHIIRGKRPNLIHNMVARLSRTFRTQIIFTTNFDQLIEQSFKRLNEPLHVLAVSAKGAVPAFSTVRAQSCLIKLHGDILETRADSSINEEPTELDKERIFNHLRGPDAPYRDQPQDFGKSDLLVLGYSANDARCVQMIKYVLDHDSEFRVFWVCFQEKNIEKIKEIFHDYKERLVFTHTKRADLLLWELYQRINLSLPSGGFTFQFSHNIPPEAADSTKEINDEAEKKAQDLIKLPSLAKRLAKLDSNSNQNSKTKEKPSGIQQLAKLARSGTPLEMDVASGVAAPMRLVFDEIAKAYIEPIWVELEDYISPIHLTFHILEIIALRVGHFQLEWTNLVPRDIWENYEEWKTNPSDEENKATLLNKTCSHINLLLHHIRVEPKKWALFLYSRNGPGGCVGLGLNYWENEDRLLLDSLVKQLGAADVKPGTNEYVGFNIVHMKFGPERNSRNQEKIKELLQIVNHQKFGKEQGETELKFFGKEDDRDAYKNWLEMEFGKFPKKRGEGGAPYPAAMHIPFSRPTKPRINDRTTDFENMMVNTLKWLSANSAPDPKDRPTRKDYQFIWLYSLTLFRKSRHSSALMSEATFPCPMRFNLGGPENDNDKFRSDCLYGSSENADDKSSSPLPSHKGWVKELTDRGIFLRKPGGYTWKYRDTRLGIQYLLEQIQNVPVGGDKMVDSIWRLRPRIHLWIGDWYLKAFYSTGHYSPLVESIYHSFQALNLSCYYVPAVNGEENEGKFAPSSKLDHSKLATLRTRNAWKAANQLLTALKFGKKSLKFWCSGLDLEATLFAVPNRKKDSSIAETFRELATRIKEADESSPGDSSSRQKSFSCGDSLHSRLITMVEVTIPREFSAVREEVLAEGGAHLGSNPPRAAASETAEKTSLNVSIRHESEDVCGAGNTWRKVIIDPTQDSTVKAQSAITGLNLKTLYTQLAKSKEPKDLQKISGSWAREQIEKWTQNGAKEEDLLEMSWFVIELAYRHVRRAKIQQHASGKTIYCSRIAKKKDSKEALKIWAQASCLLYVFLDFSKYLTTDSNDVVIPMKVRAYSLYGLCLGRLGRFFEAHRRLNESHALLARGTGFLESQQLAKIHLRRSEVSLQQALFEIKALPAPAKNTNTENDTTHTAETIVRTRRTISFLDDSWAAIEKAEESMSGTNHSTLWWSRLGTLKLNNYATLGLLNSITEVNIFPESPLIRRSCLAFRRRQHYAYTLIDLLTSLFIQGTGDYYRQLRGFHYFCGACLLADSENADLQAILGAWKVSEAYSPNGPHHLLQKKLWELKNVDLTKCLQTYRKKIDSEHECIAESWKLDILTRP